MQTKTYDLPNYKPNIYQNERENTLANSSILDTAVWSISSW